MPMDRERESYAVSSGREMPDIDSAETTEHQCDCNIAMVAKNHHQSANLPLTLDLGAAAAQALHARRALESALEHGTALLAALGLPRLVSPHFVPVDPVVAGEALAAAITVLDAIDAPAEDLEDGADDEDGADTELSLGWTAIVGQADLGRPQDDAEPTLGAPERHPFVWAFYGHPHVERAPQTHWAAGTGRDLESDVVDEPHDEETDDDLNSHPEGDSTDDEPDLGAAEFDGSGDNWRRSWNGGLDRRAIEGGAVSEGRPHD